MDHDEAQRAEGVSRSRPCVAESHVTPALPRPAPLCSPALPYVPAFANPLTRNDKGGG
jgi:hypothetical protein